jgi:hypothetical protein
MRAIIKKKYCCVQFFVTLFLHSDKNMSLLIPESLKRVARKSGKTPQIAFHSGREKETPGVRVHSLLSLSSFSLPLLSLSLFSLSHLSLSFYLFFSCLPHRDLSLSNPSLYLFISFSLSQFTIIISCKEFKRGVRLKVDNVLLHISVEERDRERPCTPLIYPLFL